MNIPAERGLLFRSTITTDFGSMWPIHRRRPKSQITPPVGNAFPGSDYVLIRIPNRCAPNVFLETKSRTDAMSGANDGHVHHERSAWKGNANVELGSTLPGSRPLSARATRNAAKTTGLLNYVNKWVRVSW